MSQFAIRSFVLLAFGVGAVAGCTVDSEERGEESDPSASVEQPLVQRCVFPVSCPTSTTAAKKGHAVASELLRFVSAYRVNDANETALNDADWNGILQRHAPAGLDRLSPKYNACRSLKANLVINIQRRIGRGELVPTAKPRIVSTVCGQKTFIDGYKHVEDTPASPKPVMASFVARDLQDKINSCFGPEASPGAFFMVWNPKADGTCTNTSEFRRFAFDPSLAVLDENLGDNDGATASATYQGFTVDSTGSYLPTGASGATVKGMRFVAGVVGGGSGACPPGAEGGEAVFLGSSPAARGLATDLTLKKSLTRRGVTCQVVRAEQGELE